MNAIACVGSRETPPDVLEWMQSAGWEIVRQGNTIVSGNAPGADQAWVRGANVVDPTKVNLCLPWENFEAGALRPGNVVDALSESAPLDVARWTRIAAATHPRWFWLSPGAKALHTRNAMIVERSQLVLGYLNPHKADGGGTGSAFRIANFLKKPRVGVGRPELREKLLLSLKQGEDSVERMRLLEAALQAVFGLARS